MDWILVRQVVCDMSQSNNSCPEVFWIWIQIFLYSLKRETYYMFQWVIKFITIWDQKVCHKKQPLNSVVSSMKSCSNLKSYFTVIHFNINLWHVEMECKSTSVSRKLKNNFYNSDFQETLKRSTWWWKGVFTLDIRFLSLVPQTCSLYITLYRHTHLHVLVTLMQ